MSHHFHSDDSIAAIRNPRIFLLLSFFITLTLALCNDDVVTKDSFDLASKGRRAPARPRRLLKEGT